MGCPTAAVSSAGYVISDLSSKFGSDMVAYVITSYDMGGGYRGLLLLCQDDSSWKNKKFGKRVWSALAWPGLKWFAL